MARHGVTGSVATDRIRSHLASSAPAILTTLERLVAIPSLPGTLAQNACQDVVLAALGASPWRVDDWTPDWPAVRELRAPRGGRRLYVPVETERGSDHADAMEQVRCVVASIGSGSPHLVLNGHVDVVPAGAGEWTSEPFVATRDGDRLVGRGTMDMKGGLAAAIFAFKALADLDLLERGTVSLASVPEEESGGNGTLACLARGHVGDAVVFGEPTHLRLVHRHVGIQSFTLTATGRAGGILRRSWGQSAVEAMADVVVALRELAAVRTARDHARGGYEPDDDPGFINVGVLFGGEWPATRAAHCTARGLMGVLPTETLDEAQADVRAAVAAARRDGSAAVDVVFGDGGHQGDELPSDHRLVEAMLGGAGDVGIDVQPTTAGTMVCDAKITSGGGWAPSVAFGPAGGGLHAADEWVDLPSVIRTAEVMAAGALRYCGSRLT